jgi:signal transduction histidine kinase
MRLLLLESSSSFSRALGAVAAFVLSQPTLTQALPAESTAKASSGITLMTGTLCVVAWIVVAIWLHRRVANRALVRERQLREFLAIVSHDLRAPLANVQGFLEIALHSRLDDEQRESILRALANARRAGSLVANLLQDAALEAKASALKKSSVQVNDVVTAVAEWAGAAAELKKIRLAVHLGNGLPAVFADSLGLSRVLANLIDNAVKFSPEGTVVKVATGLREELVWIAVEDSGPGLPHASSQNLFQPFYRSPTHPQHGGTGLGLYIVQRLVGEMDGRIHVERLPGRGSRFTVLLPAVRDALAAQASGDSQSRCIGTKVPSAQVA